jgi:hypothetical protein
MNKNELTSITAFFNTGEMVIIEYPENNLEIYEEFRTSVKNGDIFNECGWNDVTIKFNGGFLNNLNCRNIVGWL